MKPGATVTAVPSLFDEALAAERAYWQDRLADLGPAAELTPDGPRLDRPARTASIDLVLSDDLSAAVLRACRERDVLLLTLLITATKIVIARWSGLTDIMVGTTLHRQHLAVASLNTALVLRDRVVPAMRVGDLLDQVRSTLSDTYAHAKLPLAQLLELAGRRRLFQIAVVVDHINDGAHAEALDVEILLTGCHRGGALALRFDYDPALWRRDSIDAFGQQTIAVLRHIVGSTTPATLEEIDLTSASADAPALASWAAFNDTAAPYPSDRTMDALIVEQAARTGERTALVCGDTEIDYATLRLRVDAIAADLRQRGVGVGARVGLCGAHGIPLVLGLLGVLRAGACYVPIDPDLPVDRVRFICADAGLTCLLTDDVGQTRFQDLPVPLVSLETLAATRVAADPSPAASANDLAYIIYTSGSTGQPKGVAITHRSLVNYVTWAARSYLDGQEAAFALYSSLGFDLTVTSIFVPLIAGQRIVIYTDPSRSTAFLDAWTQGQVTHVKLTPSHLALIRDRDNRHTGIRGLIVGGEALTGDLALAVSDSFNGRVAIWNEYGPTEATVGCMIHRFEPDEDRRSAVPIGKPAANARIYLFDHRHRLTAPGEPGELWIGGDGLAAGYLNRDALTLERFVPQAWEGESRLYRTGDLARMLPGGVLEYLGRKDSQLKFHGVRIEEEEIRSHLRSHADIRDACVTVRRDPRGRDVMVAYYVSRSPIDTATLRAFAATALAPEVVPNHFVHLNKLPLTLNGKVNREALPPIDLTSRTGAQDAQRPNTEAEQMLAGIWSEVLGVAQVGVDDNFFALGGDSIVSLQILSRARRAGWRVEARQIFLHQTLGALAAVATRIVHDRAAAPPTPPAIAGPVPLSPMQSWWIAHGAPDHFTQAINLQVGAGLSVTALRTALDAVVARHDALRWRVAPDALMAPHDALRGRVASGADLAAPAPIAIAADSAGGRASGSGVAQDLLPFGDQGTAAGHSSAWRAWIDPVERGRLLAHVDLTGVPVQAAALVMRRAAASMHQRWDLSHGPLVRAAYFRFSASGEGRLVVVIHHCVIDAVSWGILLEDLARAYAQVRRGATPDLPVCTAWQAWVQQFGERPTASPATASPATASPATPEAAIAAHPPARRRLARVLTASSGLTAAGTARLTQGAARTWRATLEELLVAAVAVAVRRQTGDSAIPFIVEGHGRDDQRWDVSQTVGWFTSLRPCTVTLPIHRRDAAAAVDVAHVETASDAERPIELASGVRAVKSALRSAVAAAQAGAGETVGVARHAIGFNFLGVTERLVRRDSLFAPAAEDIGPTQAADVDPPFWLQVTARVQDGRIGLQWTLSRLDACPESEAPAWLDTLSAVAAKTLNELADASGAGTGTSAACLTPSDFPLAGLDQATLDTLTREYGAIDDIYPLSSLQEGMLFHTLTEPAAGVYVDQLSCRTTGVDPDRFRRAWLHVIARHPSLRTAFVWQGVPRPLQMVLPQPAVDWAVLDWTGLDWTERDRQDTGGDRQGRLEAFLAADRARGFDPGRAPLMRFTWIALGADEAHFVWSHHHIILDGWSVSRLVQEVSQAYEALGTGPLRASEGVPYRHYIAWLHEQSPDRAAEFWRAQLGPVSAATSFSLPAPPDPASAGAGMIERHARLAVPETTALSAMCRQQRLTLNTAVVGVWGCLLHGYSQQETIIFGSTIALRPPQLARSPEIVGLLINTLPIVLQIRADLPVGDWLRAAQDVQSAAAAHAHVSLPALQRWSGVPAGAPLFESLLVFENYPKQGAWRRREGGGEVSDVRFSERTNYPITAIITPGDELDIRLLADPRVCDPAAIDRLLARFVRLLRALPAQVDARLGTLTLADPDEQRLLLQRWNATTRAREEADTLPALFAAQVARTPQAVAVTWRDISWSFAELQTRATAIARRLRARGVRRESRVGIHLDRGPDMLAALLGVMQAGGAYVPLDPDYPHDRLAQIVASAAPAVIVSHSTLADSLPSGAHTLLFIDRDVAEENEASRRDEARVPRQALDPIDPIDPVESIESIDPLQLAYVIYTSGSTGVPKGVMISHAALANFLLAMQERCPLTSRDVWMAVTTLSFDIAGLELYLPLMTGARLVIADREEVLDGDALRRRLAQTGTTIMQATPAAWQVLLDAGWTAPPGFRLLCGGEATPAALVGRLIEAGGRFWNLYGPTETTIWSSAQDVAASADRRSIGFPIANTSLYVLDAERRPAPIDVAGELFIGGLGLARGYFGQPSATALRFLPDPYSDIPGGRLYRTGDVVRRRPDGALEYLGRADQQVKVRGHRIELEEIETRLGRHPDVREAIVTAPVGPDGQRSLVAYIAAVGAPPTAAQLREHLALTLPAYAIPTQYVRIDALPRLPNGKVNRAALPAPEALSRADASAGTGRGVEPALAATTDRERLIAGIWADVLQRPQVDLYDNFFDIGGHSLAAIRVIGALRRRLEIDLSILAIFEHPTVAALATHVESLLDRTAAPAVDDAAKAPPAVKPARPVRRVRAARGVGTSDGR